MENFTGKLLIAPPNIADRRFNTAVIYVAAHTDSGAWGLVINKPIIYSNTELMQRLGIDIRIPGQAHLGGPVNAGTVHILHDGREVNRQTQDMGTGIYINDDLGFLSSLMDRPTGDDFRIMVGSCSWAPGQLEGEIAGLAPWTQEHSWLVADADCDFILNRDSDRLWQDCIELAASSATSQWLC
jgi:putative transcriptional regulator